ncbi:MAG: hypothetical protein FWD58_10560 [Firmicutes bacterium]|nr:hypothetical protein [Bacillota bacterium]
MLKMLKVSFYSYKGGSGRSTTAWNTIYWLAQKMEPTATEPFVIVDTDTESAGSTFLYHAETEFFKDQDYQPLRSVQKRMTTDDEEKKNYDGASPREKADFFNSMLPIGGFFRQPPEAVRLIGVNLDKRTTVKADANTVAQLNNFSYNIKTACKSCGAKALFFDTPSGTQPLAQRSVLDSDIIVCCMRPTSQFRAGTKGQLVDFVKCYGNAKTFILTPTAVCMRKEYLFGDPEKYPGQAKEDIWRQFSEDVDSELFRACVKLDMLPKNSDEFGIPEVDRFKWRESCLGRLDEKELTLNDREAIARYDFLADKILEYWNR